ncbi:MAG: replicative DNA helicase [Planctomycetota bacterium]
MSENTPFSEPYSEVDPPEPRRPGRRGGSDEDLQRKLPPHSIDAEMCLLASMSLDKDVIGEVVQKVDRDAFYLADHQIIFESLVRLWQDNKPVDTVLLREDLDKRQLLDEVGGTRYLADILAAVPSAAHAMHYAGVVREKAMLRRLIEASNKTLQDAYAPHESAEQVLDRAEKRVFDLQQQKVSGDVVSLGSVAEDVYGMIEDKARAGLMTEFVDLDDMLHGLQNGEMVIVAARPSMGKTAIAMNIVENVAAQKVPVGVFSLEMSKQQLAQRLMCSRAGIDAQRVRKGTLRAEEYQKLALVVTELDQFPVWVDDTPGLTIMDLRAKARRLAMQRGVRMLMIDYMQLMEGTAGIESRQQQITEISRGIKGIARELNIPVICLSQLNRQSEGRDGHRPRMSDLRESGSIEQDADVVLLLHREDYYRQTNPDFVPDNIAEVIVAKQRNGPTGTVKLTFDNKTTTFRNLASQIDAL